MKIKRLLPILSLAGMMACQSPAEAEKEKSPEAPIRLLVNTEMLSNSTLDSGQNASFTLEVPVAGRYKTAIFSSNSSSETRVWVEDYVNNPDDRTYDITGKIQLGESGEKHVIGSPLNAVSHPMRIHCAGGHCEIDSIVFTLLRTHKASPEILEQNMQGEEWELVWSDEFDGASVDTSKWTYDLGNWGWGNNELQYYTANREENARTEDGVLLIEARKDDMGEDWTSARLTTRGKVAFRYGKIEFRAKVPREKGNWAAGWTLGNSYVDEKSWPYCGEIDILESVGYEVNDSTGDGIAHATVHTPAYYFKIGNQISSTIPVKDMVNTWHTYAVEWTPEEIFGLVDDSVYYHYDKNADEREWPFHEPQNIILNLAMGGGWGGAKGMDSTVSSQIFSVDYVRVYQKSQTSH